MKEGIVYILRNKINDKVYIGQTIQPLMDRFRRHCSMNASNSELNMPIKRAIAKYGAENFSVEVLYRGEELNKMEIYYIGLYDSYRDGYNATIGGVLTGRECLINDSELNRIKQLYDSNMSLLNISKIYNVDKKTISTFLKKHNVHIRTFVDRFSKYNVSREELVILLDSGLTQKQISEKLGLKESYIPRLITKYNLQRIKNLQECSDPTNLEG